MKVSEANSGAPFDFIYKEQPKSTGKIFNMW